MERKIGEIFEYNGEWYQRVEGDSCGECSLFTTECRSGTKSDLADKVFGECSKIRRLDSKHVIFKKLEKVGEPFIGKVHIQLQRYKIYTEPIIDPAEKVGYVNEKNTIAIELKQNKEDMEGKKIQHYDCFFDEKSSKSNLKPFDLKAAKAGKPVCTRDGRKARIICFDTINEINYPIIALIKGCGYETLCYYNEKGKAHFGNTFDLMMLPEKKEGWILLRKDGCVFDNEEVAKKNCTNDYCVAKVEWEE